MHITSGVSSFFAVHENFIIFFEKPFAQASLPRRHQRSYLARRNPTRQNEDEALRLTSNVNRPQAEPS